MKSILKNALVGLLLVAGTTKPVATLEHVKDALKGVLPVDAKSDDTTINHCLGGANSVFWVCKYIDEKLAANTTTQNCTSFSYEYAIPCIKALSEDHASDTQVKLIPIKENSAVIAGLKLTFTAEKCTKTEYLDATATNALITKPSVPARWGALYSALNYPTHFSSTVRWYGAGLAAAGFGLWYINNLRTENATLAAQLAKLTSSATPKPTSIFGGGK